MRCEVLLKIVVEAEDADDARAVISDTLDGRQAQLGCIRTLVWLSVTEIAKED